MPEGMGQKAQAFGDMIGGIGSVLKMWGENQEALTSDMTKGSSAQSTNIAQMVGRIADIMGLDVWMRTSNSLQAASGVNIDPDQATSWMTGARKLGEMSVSFMDMGEDISRSGIMDLDVNSVTVAMTHIADVVDAYNEQAARLSSITPLNIDAVLEEVNESLRVRRDRITIADGNVEIHMTLNVTMNALDIARPLIRSEFVTRGSSTRVNSLGQPPSRAD